MTAQPPPDPRSSRRRALDFDEFIAILVAFASLGTVLAWGLTRSNENFLANQPGLLAIPGIPGGQSETATPEAGSGNLLIVPPADRTAGQGITPPAQPPGVSVSPLPGAVSPGRSTAIVPVPLPQRATDPSGRVIQPAQPDPLNPVEQPTQTPAADARSAQPAPPAGVAAPFPDVPSNYWAAPFIAALTQRGDISGFRDGTFRPDQPVTRAEFATLIQETFDQTNQQEPIAFKDVPGGFWAASAIDSAVKTGFLRGFPEGTFQPDLPIPRMQALVALTSGLNLTPPANPEQTLQLFRDRDQVPRWGIPAVASAAEAELIVNHPSPDILNPNQPATRAEVAAFLYQALVSTGQAAPISSNFIVRP